MLVAETTNGAVTYLYSDHLGTPIMGARTESLSWTKKFTPFGEEWASSTALSDRVGFTGHITDTDTGLTYMQARYYDPVIGRFLSVDPVGFASGGPAYFNRYVYTANDPVNKTDPTGMFGENMINITGMGGDIDAQQRELSRNAPTRAALGSIAFEALASDAVQAGKSLMQGDLKGAAVAATLAVSKPLKVIDKLGDVGRAAPKPDFITNSNGVTMPTNKDYNLVDTKTPTNQGGDWMQIHNKHDDAAGGGSPHTHRPGAVSSGPGGQNRPRETSQTTGADMDRADQKLKSGELRERENRRDRGG